MIASLLLATIMNGHPADMFMQSVGYNTHLDSSAGIYPNQAFQERVLAAFHARGVRSSLTIYNSGNNYAAFLNKLYDDLGITTDEIAGTSIKTTAQAKTQLAMRRGVRFIEGPNEGDLNDKTWVADDLTTMNALAPLYPNITTSPVAQIVEPSVSFADPQQLFTATPSAQFGNMHPYRGKRKPETLGWGGDVYGNGTIYGSLAYNIATARRALPGAPVVATEDGYSTSDVTEQTQVFYNERILLFNYISGVAATFLYTLGDDSEGFGQYRIDGTPKLAATGIAGMMQILDDPGYRFLGKCQLNATITTSVPYDSLLLCKASGERDLVLWQPWERQNPDTGVAEPVTPAKLTITASTGGRTIFYQQDAKANWSATVRPANGVISGQLIDAPLVIALGAPAPVVFTAVPSL
jgi:hypothetical protein